MIKKKWVERREHQRIQVKSGAFVGIGPHFNQVGPLVDISKGGLSFRYTSRKKQAKGLSLDIFLTDRDFYLGYVPFKAVSDSKTPDNPSGSATIRQCTVQFGELTPDQISYLQDFIQDHTIGEA